MLQSTFLASNKENISDATNISRSIKHGKQSSGCGQSAKRNRHTSHLTTTPQDIHPYSQQDV
jgi:hypothetical protein